MLTTSSFPTSLSRDRMRICKYRGRADYSPPQCSLRSHTGLTRIAELPQVKEEDYSELKLNILHLRIATLAITAVCL